MLDDQIAIVHRGITNNATQIHVAIINLGIADTILDKNSVVPSIFSDKMPNNTAHFIAVRPYHAVSGTINDIGVDGQANDHPHIIAECQV